ncbi:Sec1-like family protein [Cavenderia fasciculata]|uniref:Sec1-like family protein n=1 Tax=Cavenderia fasciculata TaxID=261658 RepID=F4QAS7_CACFS|nr:Sec1-like family protein [Cavenderia fasciculata]EGG15780.1 Sec1-like family protein [Cavenderia fasciculata]|eukprot:XP_004354527.1 Sec1-like family protein [Cavenderia fasciculata]
MATTQSNQMNVIHAIREYINKMLEKIDGMKVLVLDQETAGIVSMVYTQSEILQKEVFLFEKIDSGSAEKMTHMKAVYFVRPTQHNVSKIADELRNPKYSDYHLFFSNVIGSGFIDEIAKADDKDLVKEVQEFYADFYAVNQDSFNLNINGALTKNTLAWKSDINRIVEGVFSSLLALKRKPTIRYSEKSEASKFLAATLNDKILKERDLFTFKQQSSLLLILDRKDDPVTPLLHQWTYQAMVHELLGIHNNVVNLTGSKFDPTKKDHTPTAPGQKKESKDVILSTEQDAFFKDNLYLNYGDLGASIKNLVDTYQEKMHTNANIQTIDDMKKFIENYPNFQKFSTTVSKHVSLMEELSKRISEDFLMDISEIQQELACNHEHNTAYSTMVEVLENRKYNLQDKLVLVLLYSLRYEDGRIWELKELLAKSGLSNDEISLISTLHDYAGANKREGDLFENKNLFRFVKQMATRGLNGVSNIYTQHKPLIHDILHHIQNDKLSIQSYPFISPQTTREKPTDIIIFVVGGITFEECYNVFTFNSMNKGSGKVVLGGTNILNCKQFLDDLRGLRVLGK